MTTPRTRIELRRGSDLAIIMSAIEGACPAVPADAIGLADIAELCRRHVLSHPGLDWNEWLGQSPEMPYNHVLCQKG